MEPVEPDDPAVPGAGRTLVVVIHGLRGSAHRMRDVVAAVRDAYGPRTVVYAPDLPHGRLLSTARAVAIVRTLLAGVDARVGDVAPDRIVLVGHSVGATLARRLFLVAAGRPTNFAIERAFADQPHRSWATKVERIVMLAAFNRGWQVSERMGWFYAALFNVVGLVGHVLPARWGRAPTAFDFRLGAPFMVQTRLHWLAYRRNPPPGIVHAERPMLIQLLGTQDDLVAPVDQVDLAVDGSNQAFLDGQSAQDASGQTVQDYFLIEMPQTNHVQAIEVRGDGVRQTRGRLLQAALTSRRGDLTAAPGTRPIALDPALLVDEIDGLDNRVRDTVFVIHGIRDDGFWTHRIAERVRELGGTEADGATKFRSWTQSYGYFAMLPFILPWTRFEKVEWFADQYVTAFAQYPRSNFHYVGHSNGTYLAARALKDYPAIHFKHVLFAGSVVRRDYPWRAMVAGRRVHRFQNLVATGDWVVALLPKSLEWLRAFDLGGAGFDGFRDAGTHPHVTELRCLVGGHGAGIREEHWHQIAAFIVHGRPFTQAAVEPPSAYRRTRSPWLAALSRPRLGVAVVGLFGLAVCALGYWLGAWLIGHLGGGLFGLLVAVLILRFFALRF